MSRADIVAVLWRVPLGDPLFCRVVAKGRASSERAAKRDDRVKVFEVGPGQAYERVTVMGRDIIRPSATFRHFKA